MSEEQPTNGQIQDTVETPVYRPPPDTLELQLSKEQRLRKAAEDALEAVVSDRMDFLEWLLAVNWHPSLVDQQKLDEMQELIQNKLKEIKGSADGKPQ